LSIYCTMPKPLLTATAGGAASSGGNAVGTVGARRVGAPRWYALRLCQRHRTLHGPVCADSARYTPPQQFVLECSISHDVIGLPFAIAPTTIKAIVEDRSFWEENTTARTLSAGRWRRAVHHSSTSRCSLGGSPRPKFNARCRPPASTVMMPDVWPWGAWRKTKLAIFSFGKQLM
jgi:hypothetical protein